MCLPAGIFLCVVITKFQPNATQRLVMVPTAPLTRRICLCLSQWMNCRPGNTQNGGTVLPIASLMADSELESPDSYSSFLVTIRLCRLVSEIFACDRQRDRQTTRTIPIAGPHIVAGQLIDTRVAIAVTYAAELISEDCLLDCK